MVAGDTKKIVVIKNISSNLIEEAILILRSEPAASGEKSGKPPLEVTKGKNDFILKEAENIINQYIKENGLKVVGGRKRFAGRKISHAGISVNVLINCLLLGAIAFLLLVVCRLI